jgi:hypothetical protein
MRGAIVCYCSKCDYRCCYRSEFRKHLMTTKHNSSKTEKLNPSKTEKLNLSKNEKLNPSKNEKLNPSKNEKLNLSKNEKLNPSKNEKLNPSKIGNKFVCKKCNYNTSNKKDYTKHTKTTKHNQPENYQPENYQQMPTDNNLTCDCGNKYKERSGLWRHKKKCNQKNQEIVNQDKCRETSDNSTILGLISQNKELMEMLKEQNKIIKELVQKSG